MSWCCTLYPVLGLWLIEQYILKFVYVCSKVRQLHNLHMHWQLNLTLQILQALYPEKVPGKSILTTHNKWFLIFHFLTIEMLESIFFSIMNRENCEQIQGEKKNRTQLTWLDTIILNYSCNSIKLYASYLSLEKARIIVLLQCFLFSNWPINTADTFSL